MKKSKILITAAMALMTLTASAQRFIDKLDRGVIAMKTTSGVFVSWRIQSDEYYDVTYNLYRDGVKIAENLKVSNYKDASGTTSSKYTVAAVVRGKEQSQSKAAETWQKSYKEIRLAHEGIASTLVPNDACCADVDGDGEVEILMKFDNASEMQQSYPKDGPVINGKATKEYSIFEVFKLDGTRLWWVNCGPNMGDFQNNEQNIVGYDWDMDGKAEVLMRLEEGSTIHYADGSTYTIGADGKNGTSWKNYRGATGGGTNWFMHDGKEFLVYCNGSTGQIYQCIDFPLARLEAGENDLNAAWGDGYGHRSSKFFFGAPYLDGRKPSIFLARGIYTRHKMIAYDVDPATHRLKERWRWYNNTNGPWKGQGYHNYSIADVDWDGRDEICFGSMVIDDNGKGLSTTGLGHGDAQHVGNFNPYLHGQEIYACNEDRPGNNYRDATTSKMYHRFEAGNDDGRAMMDNFSNQYPGSIGCSAREGAISSVTNGAVSGMTATGINTNFRIYWDGDLCSETFNYINGKNTEGCVAKYGSWSPIYTMEGSMTNNDTKGTPCYQGDVLGDWREEVIMRTADNNIRIYSTPTETKWRNYSLWYDKQYRNAMVWQMCGYNQPPHTSYFLGELEGITAAPPAETMEGRTEVANGGTISNADEAVITCEPNDMTVAVAEGASPYLYIDNTPSWVQGSAPSEANTTNYSIKRNYFTHTLTGGAFAGEMRLVKQGDGALVLPNVKQLYSGATEVWAGTINFDGTLENSPLWLNRLTRLNTNGGVFAKGIKADYGSVICIGGESQDASSLTTDTLALGFGSAVEFDIYGEGLKADMMNAKVLTVEKKRWPNGGGPDYSTPVFRINAHVAQGAEVIADGEYLLGNVGEVVGNLNDIVIENMTNQKTTLRLDEGKLWLTVKNFEAEPVTWTGGVNSYWNLDKDDNFTSDVTGDASKFVTGSDVTFNDSAKVTTVVVVGNVAPASITFNNETKNYTLAGDSIVGGGTLTKNGAASLTINNENHIGNTTINGGTVYPASLANNTGSDFGSLGSVKQTITLSNGGALGINKSMTSGQPVYCDANGGVINVASGATLSQAATIYMKNAGTLTKKGAGTLTLTGTLAPVLTVAEGTVSHNGTNYVKTVTLQGKSTITGAGFASSTFEISSAANATITLTGNNYAAYNGALKGSGSVTINPTNTVNRVRITGNWSAFTGTVKYTNTNITLPLDNSYGLANGTLDLAAGTRVSNVAKTYAIGKLTGSGELHQPESNYQNQSAVSGSNTWKVGNSWENNGDFTFAGSMYDTGGSNKCNFEKVGSCVMTVTGVWANSGTVKINGGELKANSGKTLGTGALTVGEGATYSVSCGSILSSAKKSPLTNSSYTINGTLQVGLTPTTTSAYAEFGGKNVTINATGTLHIAVAKCATASATGCSSIGNIGTLTMKDGATLSVSLGATFAPTATEEKADSFRIFHDVQNPVIGKLNFDLPRLDAGYHWDTSRVSEGYLLITYGLVGDVNKDGQVDVADINAVIETICGGTQYAQQADVNGDGSVDISDINAIISVICGE